jgi:hypothetical protein
MDRKKERNERKEHTNLPDELMDHPVPSKLIKNRKKEELISLYNLFEYDNSQLVQMMQRIMAEATVIGGLPKHHLEVFEKRGWLLPFLLGYENLYWGRWDYWLDIIERNTIEGSGPIPKIEWSLNSRHVEVGKKMLHRCLDSTYYEGGTIDQFSDWLLWGLAASKEPPKVSKKVNQTWYELFDLSLVLRNPTDYLSGLLEFASSQGYKNALGYFSTPPSVTSLMVDLVYGTINPEEAKSKVFYEPCVGCGAIALPASNYTLFACMQDVNLLATKLCRIQMYWYAPWFAMNPFPKP